MVEPISAPPDQDPGIDLFHFGDKLTPWASTWWNSRTVTQVPETSVGWFLAQGWRVTAITHDNTARPPVAYYALAKDEMDTTYVLQSLLNEYTVAFNDARYANQERYNEVVTSWESMFSGTQDYHEDQLEDQDTFVASYLSNLDTYMTEVNTLIDSTLTALNWEEAEATNAATVMNNKLSELETNADANAVTVAALLTAAATALENYKSAYSHELAKLDPDYTTQEIVTTNLLDGLGASEFARIHEHFDAALAEQLQSLVDKGLYSSVVAEDLRERNARDRDEQLQKLYDQLNREKVDNRHKLYGEQQAMRDRVLAGTDRQHGTEQDVIRMRIAEYDTLLGQLQDAVKGILAGKERYSTLTMQNASTMAEHKHRAIAELMGEFAARLQGQQSVHADSMKLMSYMLAERNQLLVGLYGFVERREDIGPGLNDLTSLAVGLGDSGAGWVSP